MLEILIATLGTESQVVTLSLLELERMGFKVGEVVVVHTSGLTPEIRAAMDRLDDAFANNERLRRYRYKRELLQAERGPIADITTEAEAEATFNALFQIVRHYKLNDYRVHLNIAGGRKPMSIYGMVTAQMLFDERDRLWHLVSNEPLVKSRRLFPEDGDEYQLVPVPVIRASDRPDLLRHAENAYEAVKEQQTLRRDMEIELFLAKLTKTQRKVAELLGKGLANEELGHRLNQKPNTLSKHLTVIYGEWRNQFNVTTENVRGLIVAELTGYFLRKEGRK